MSILMLVINLCLFAIVSQAGNPYTSLNDRIVYVPVQQGGMSFQVQTADLPAGVYTVLVSGECIEFTERLVILR